MKRLALFLALAAAAHAAPPESFWRALHIVETGGRHGAILGDNGKALGPLQIHRGYHADARIGGDYSRCADLDYSKRVVSAYLQRYAPKAWAAGDVETLARVHNGGPAGARKAATVNYGAKVARLVGGAR
jgi:Destabilase